MENLKQIANAFNLDGKIISIEPCGNGRINRTFKVLTNTINGKREYILQKINTDLFTNPNELMENIKNVTRHIALANPNSQVLNVVSTKNGDDFLSFNGESFRVYDYIPNSISIENPAVFPIAFYECGKIFGEFQNSLSNFDATLLHETIPNFHNTPLRFQAFLNALNEDKCDRAQNCEGAIDFCIEMSELLGLDSIIVNQIENGTLPLRVTHNDTKLNNVAFDKKSKTALAVLDLDTVMPGALCYDFGDAIRFGCNSEDEESTNFENITFNMELFKLYTKGYLEVAKDFITEAELNSLVDGCLVMTYEVGMRFLTDYLQGDPYFGAKYEDNNLNRAINQFSHLNNMLNIKHQMQAVVNETYKELTQSSEVEK